MCPFLYIFLTAKGVGIDWLVPRTLLNLLLFDGFDRIAYNVFGVLSVMTPVLLLVKVWRRHGRPLPIISLLVLYSNAIWWFALRPMDAFVWATIFHGIQYLAIVTIFHVNDQTVRIGNAHGKIYHVCWFYLVCLLLGYSLFNVLPLAYLLAGFGKVESVLMVIAAINIHHFVVDAYIWRLKKTDSNRRVVDAAGQVIA